MSVVRRITLGVAAGAVAGLVVGGIWGRIFMFILASLNPEDHGTKTDDGFAMGQFTVGGTINLLTATAVIGAIGGLVFLALRGLRVGPAWFGTASLALGAVLVIGAILLHSDGVDFTRLEPIGLAVALTLSVPLLYAVAVTWLGDRWLGDGPTFWQRLPVELPWIARGVLAVVAVVAAVDLAGTLADIFDDNQFT